MKPHEIDFRAFQSWLEDAEIEFASSTREYKSLRVSTKGNMIVRVAGMIVWQGIQPYAAVEAYNAITEKYVSPVKDFKL